ncbi:MAG TPA: GNAT family N-acyltransferase [Dongiaceae bacterium]|jgi:putative hemolysin|nr:GNAT family N-acyltransferase [Dongiaceae bacterium]
MNPEPPLIATAARSEPVNLASGPLTIRLAALPAEVAAAQRLRYSIFYEEMAAQPTAEMRRLGRDFDALDEYCDHLIVVDENNRHRDEGIVATYRLLRRSGAARAGGFYSRTEYDITPILAYPGEILELGRSCVALPYRTKAVMQLLWKGITDYVMYYKIGIMFGCASFPGTDPLAHAPALAYLARNHLAPAELCPRALDPLYVSMDPDPTSAVDAKRALASLPPLIKGYLRLGGFVGDGAVIDEQFDTVDVSILVVTDLVTSKYVKHYTR